MIARLICLCATLLLLATHAAAQDFDKGLAAARAGDFAAAAAQWRPLAEDGNVEAQFNLGALYESGLGVPKNFGAAAGWYELAAGQGHASAQYNLGVMYADGRGVARDYVHAAEWLRRAAEQGHAKAQYNLALLYQAGRGVAKDLVQARIWFARAASNGIPLPKNEPSKSAGEEPAPSSHATAGSKSTAARLAHRRVAGIPPASPTAAPPSDLLQVVTTVAAGTSYKLELTESQRRIRDGVTEMRVSTIADIDMTITPASGEGAIVEWVFRKYSVKDSDGSIEARIAKTECEVLQGRKIEYRTDNKGVVTGLRNSREVAALYNTFFERVLAVASLETKDRMIVETIRSSLEPARSGSYLETLTLESPKLLHFFSGFKLDARQRYGQKNTMHLRLDGTEVPSDLIYELAWFDRTKNVAWLRWSQMADRHRTRQAVESFMHRLARKAGRRLPRGFDVGAISVVDEAVYEIDLKTGMPKSVIFSERSEMLGFVLIESRQIKVQQ